MDNSHIGRLIEEYGEKNFPYLNNQIINKGKINDIKKKITVAQYMEIIKQHKELHIFMHRLTLNHPFGELYLLVNEEEIILLTRIAYEIKKDDENYSCYINQEISYIDLET